MQVQFNPSFLRKPSSPLSGLLGSRAPGHIQGQDACMSERGLRLPYLIKSPPGRREESTGRTQAAFEVMPKPLSRRNLGVVGVGRGKRCVCRWSGAQNTEDDSSTIHTAGWGWGSCQRPSSHSRPFSENSFLWTSVPIIGFSVTLGFGHPLHCVQGVGGTRARGLSCQLPS